MSARQLFVPARAPSRAASNGSAAQDKLEPSSLDLVPSANGSGVSETISTYADTSTVIGASKHTPIGPHSNIVNGINKPLNIAGFAKRRNKPEQQIFSTFTTQPRRSFEGAVRSGESGHAQQQVPRRPFSPFFPHAQEILPSQSRGPRRSSPSRLQETLSAEDLSSNHAHIPTSSHSSAAPINVENSAPRSYSSSAFRASARPSLEKIHGAAGDDDSTGRQEAPPMHANGQDAASLRRFPKRLERPEPEVEDEFDYEPAVKRYKADHRAEQRDVESPSYDRSSPVYIQETLQPVRFARSVQPEFPAYEDQRSPAAPHAPEESALRKLFGQDLDKFADEHLEAYNEARKKWSECSAEEWQAGADELTVKFAKVLDFVKNHMTTKTSLYTRLHANITNHRAVLSEREKMLKGAQENLVRSGGGVIGASKLAPKKARTVPQTQQKETITQADKTQETKS